MNVEAVRARILMVEDSATQAIQFRRMLESHGFAVEVAGTAETALDALNGALPDLVIADFHLPGMNGDELARQLRLNMRTRAIPVLMLTEMGGGTLERHGLESGADAYLPKSSTPDHLLQRIHALLRQQADIPAPRRRSDLAGTRFRRARVVVLDDEAAPAARLREILSEDGHTVAVAAGPEAALAALSGSEAPDCILVPVRTPSFDGIAAVAGLDAARRQPGAPGAAVQIVAVVPDDDDGTLQAEGFAAGADDVVAAGTDPDILGVRVRSAVRRKIVAEENRRIDAEAQQRELALERLRAETAAAEVRAGLAGQLARANEDLAETNRKLREAQASLVQSAKMASLGELVAGIAHEINNPLAFILAHQRTVDRTIANLAAETPDGPTRQRIEKAGQRAAAMRTGLERIQDLVLRLRRFSRLDEGSFQAVDVPEGIETILSLLAHKLGDRVAVERDYQAAPELVCSPALLNQVVMNIVGNAADAVDAAGGGTIRIATRDEGDSFVMTVSDSGPGVPDAIRDRIFEPFFTTKPVGAGTGLGLAIAYGIVQAHDGTIAVDRGPEGGARFTIRIPRTLTVRATLPAAGA